MYAACRYLIAEILNIIKAKSLYTFHHYRFLSPLFLTQKQIALLNMSDEKKANEQVK